MTQERLNELKQSILADLRSLIHRHGELHDQFLEAALESEIYKLRSVVDVIDTAISTADSATQGITDEDVTHDLEVNGWFIHDCTCQNEPVRGEAIKAHNRIATRLNRRPTAEEVAQIKPECEICKPDVMEGNPITWKHSDGYVGDGKFSSAGRIASHCPNCGKELTKNG